MSETFSVQAFIESQRGSIPIFPYIHVNREEEIDYRTLYSRYIADAISAGQGVLNFAEFRGQAGIYLGEKR